MNPDEVAPKGGTPGYSYISETGTRVDVASRREGERLDSRTLDQLRAERDATVSAGLPTRYNQQTIVGNVSGAGNRHVIEDTPSPRRIVNTPGVVFDSGIGGACNPSEPPSSGTWVWGSIDGECQWIATTECP